MPNPICVNCEVSFKPSYNGAKIFETFTNSLKVYKIWSADIWQCPKCGVEVVFGFGSGPLHEKKEHFETDFQSRLDEIIKNPNARIVYSRDLRGEAPDAE